jgi:fucose 4-O-acetylase-like acetyltransferase
MKRWRIWIALAIVTFFGAAFSFLGIWMNVDLGNDKYPGGKAIIATGFYAMLALGVAAIACVAVAVRVYRQSVSHSETTSEQSGDT